LAALGAPYSGIADREFFPTPVQKIAVLGHRLMRYHPFTDGNKRTARIAMRLLADRYGLTWTDHSEDDAVHTIEAAAAGTMPEEQFAAWVAERLS
jgi:death-on-curing protein